MKSTTHNARGEILVPLSVDDIKRIIDDITSELAGDMYPPPDDNDPAAVLKAWRKHSPRYVTKERQMAARNEREGLGRGLPFDLECAKKTRAMHDESADLLQRLLSYLPKHEVADV